MCRQPHRVSLGSRKMWTCEGRWLALLCLPFATPLVSNMSISVRVVTPGVVSRLWNHQLEEMPDEPELQRISKNPVRTMAKDDSVEIV